MSALTPSRWMSPRTDKLFADEPELIDAYNMEPYPEDMSGEGEWMMLYNDNEPFAILWHSPVTDSVGIEAGHNCFQGDLLTVEGLRLRLYNNAGLSASAAYHEVAGRYESSPEQMTDDLASIKRMMVRP